MSDDKPPIIELEDGTRMELRELTFEERFAPVLEKLNAAHDKLSRRPARVRIGRNRDGTLHVGSGECFATVSHPYDVLFRARAVDELFGYIRAYIRATESERTRMEVAWYKATERATTRR